MKILVFDDSEGHRQAAAILLKEHELTIVSTYDEAEKALTTSVDEDKVDEELKKRFGDFNPWGEGVDSAQRYVYRAARGEATRAFTNHPEFDVVLTDLLVPASAKAQERKGVHLVGQEMPLGTIIALHALAAGVKLVAVVTNISHHDHPASAAFDAFPGTFSMGEIRVLCTNRGGITLVDAQTFEEISHEFLCSDEGKRKYPINLDTCEYKGTTYVKDWREILDTLLRG